MDLFLSFSGEWEVVSHAGCPCPQCPDFLTASCSSKAVMFIAVVCLLTHAHTCSLFIYVHTYLCWSGVSLNTCSFIHVHQSHPLYGSPCFTWAGLPLSPEIKLIKKIQTWRMSSDTLFFVQGNKILQENKKYRMFFCAIIWLWLMPDIYGLFRSAHKTRKEKGFWKQPKL